MLGRSGTEDLESNGNYRHEAEVDHGDRNDDRGLNQFTAGKPWPKKPVDQTAAKQASGQKSDPGNPCRQDANGRVTKDKIRTDCTKADCLKDEEPAKGSHERPNV